MSKFRHCIAAGFLCTGLAIFAASAASAQTYNAADTAVPSVSAQGAVLGASGARVAVPAPAVSSQVLSLQVSQPAPVATGGRASVTGLAFTGSDVATLLMIAVPLIALGFTLTRKARPRHPSQA